MYASVCVCRVRTQNSCLYTHRRQHWRINNDDLNTQKLQPINSGPCHTHTRTQSCIQILRIRIRTQILRIRTPRSRQRKWYLFCMACWRFFYSFSFSLSFFLFPISIAVLLQFASSPVSFALSPASCFSALCSVFSLSCRLIVQSAAFGWNICKVLLDTQSPFPAHSHLPARFTTIRGIYVRIYENGLVVVPVHRPLPRR